MSKKPSLFSRRSNASQLPRTSQGSPMLGLRRPTTSKGAPPLPPKPSLSKPLVKSKRQETASERIMREDKLLYDCVQSLGMKRAVFVEYIDWLDAIFQDKAIYFCDHPAIKGLRSKLPHLARPCDILYDQKELLMSPAKLSDRDLSSLIAIRDSIMGSVENLSEGVKEVLDTFTLTEKTKNRLLELPSLVSGLYKAYDQAITDLKASTRESRAELLTSNPHIKSPFLPYPLEISRELYNRMNSVDEHGVHYKENASGRHHVTNTTVDAPVGHDAAYKKRFTSKDGKIRLFFKANVDPRESDEFILPAAERRNGFAIRVFGAHAASSMWCIVDEGLSYPGKEQNTPNCPAYAANFVKRNSVQIGIGVNGQAIEDIKILEHESFRLLSELGAEDFYESLEKMMDTQACDSALTGEAWYVELSQYTNLPMVTDVELVREISEKIALALSNILQGFPQEYLPKEASLFLEHEQKEHACGFITRFLSTNRPKDFIRYLAQINSAPKILKQQSLSDTFYYFAVHLSIYRYYFPKTDVTLLPEKLAGLIQLISKRSYYDWTKSSDFCFSDCTGGNIFLEPVRRDPTTLEPLEIYPVDIDHAEGPEHEAVRHEKTVRRRHKTTQEWENYQVIDHFVQMQSVVQLLDEHMSQVIPNEFVQEDAEQHPYFTFAEFLKCLAFDREVNEQSLEKGIIVPSDFDYEGKARLDLFEKFHKDIYFKIFRRGVQSYTLLPLHPEYTYWNRFKALYSIAGPTYEKLLEKHNGDILVVLQQLKRGMSVRDVFDDELDQVFGAKLNGRGVDTKDHINGKTLSFKELNLQLHQKEVSVSHFDEDTMLDFYDLIGEFYPQAELIDKIKDSTHENLDSIYGKAIELILLAAQRTRKHALALLLGGLELVDEKLASDTANKALSVLIRFSGKNASRDVLNAADAILRFVKVAEKSPELIKELLDGKREPYLPFIEICLRVNGYQSVLKNLIRKLVKTGFDIEARDANGLSAVDHAVQQGNVGLFTALVECGDWKFFNEVKVVEFLIQHDQEIPSSAQEKIRRNSRVAAEFIRRAVILDAQSDTCIPIKTLNGTKHMPLDFADQFVDKLSFWIQEDKSVKESRKVEKHGTRPVVGINYQGVKCHVKIDPEFRLLELFAQECAHTLFGFGTSCSHVIQLDKETFKALVKLKGGSKAPAGLRQLEKKGKPIYVLISDTVQGQDCQSVVRQNDGNILAQDETFDESQLADYMRIVLLMIIKVFRDAKLDNIIKSDDLRFCLIDKAVNSLPPFKDDKLEFLCALFNKEEMYEAILPQIIYEILSINLDAFYTKMYDGFSNSVEAHKRFFGEPPDMPSEINSDWVKINPSRARQVQSVMSKALTLLLSDDEPMELMSVLQRTLPETWLAYRHGNKQGNTDAERFLKSTQSVLSQLMNIYAGTKINTAVALKTRFTQSVGKTPRFRKRVQYDPAQAARDFDDSALKADHLSDVTSALVKGDVTLFVDLRVTRGADEVIFTLDDLREKVINQIDFSNVTARNQRAIIDCLKSKEGLVDFKSLRLLNMTELTKKDLKEILGNCTQLRELNLRGCTGLNTDGAHFRLGERVKVKNRFATSLLDIIKQEAPQLISLDLSGSSVAEIKFAGTDLEQLEYLYLENCPALFRVHIDSQFLKHLSIENNPELERLHFLSNVLRVLNLKGCPKLPATVLQKLLSEASKLKRFTFEPADDFNPRTLAWHVFEAWRPDVSRFSTDHRATRHVVKAMIKNGVLALGALPITETDVNDIATILSSLENKKDPLNCTTLDLRGISTFHRSAIRRLVVDMMCGRNGLTDILCQPKIRPKEGADVREAKLTDQRINDMVISPEGDVVIAANDALIRFVDPSKIGVEDPVRLTLRGHERSARSLMFTINGELISGGSNECIKWNLKEMQPLETHKVSYALYSIMPYTSESFVTHTSQNVVQIYNDELSLKHSHRSPEHYASEPYSIVSVLPTDDIIYTSEKIPGTIRLWSPKLLERTQEYKASDAEISIFTVGHDGNLLTVSSSDIVKWNYSTWNNLTPVAREVEDCGDELILLPSNEYLVHECIKDEEYKLQIYNDTFDKLLMSKDISGVVTAMKVTPSGHIVYACDKKLKLLEASSLNLSSELLRKCLTQFTPLFIDQSVYLQCVNTELSTELLPILEALFGITPELLHSSEQERTLKLTFATEESVREFQKFWYEIQNLNTPEIVVNTQQHVNISGLHLSDEDLMYLAKQSPCIETLQGLQSTALTAEVYGAFISYCPILRTISCTDTNGFKSPSDDELQDFGDPATMGQKNGIDSHNDISLAFRDLLPRGYQIIEENDHIIVEFSRSLNQLQQDAWNKCLDFISTVMPGDLCVLRDDVGTQSNSGANGSDLPVIPAKAGIQSRKYNIQTTQTADLHALLSALLTKRQVPEVVLPTVAKKPITNGLSRVGFNNLRRSSSEYTHSSEHDGDVALIN